MKQETKHIGFFEHLLGPGHAIETFRADISDLKVGNLRERSFCRKGNQLLCSCSIVADRGNDQIAFCIVKSAATCWSAAARLQKFSSVLRYVLLTDAGESPCAWLLLRTACKCQVNTFVLVSLHVLRGSSLLENLCCMYCKGIERCNQAIDRACVTTIHPLAVGIGRSVIGITAAPRVKGDF
jgi:hypothetical protein